jgi:hypothetical protein
MSFLDQITEANQGQTYGEEDKHLLLSQAAEEADELSKINFMDIDADSALSVKKKWTKEVLVTFGKALGKIHEKVDELRQDKKYDLWLKTTSQQDIAKDLGINQSTVSRLFGPAQKEFKSEQRAKALELEKEGYDIDEIRKQLDIDITPRTLYRWLENAKTFDMPPESKSLAEEGDGQYLLKLTKIEDELQENKKKLQDCRKELRNCKTLINAKDEKISELLMEITALKMSQK